MGSDRATACRSGAASFGDGSLGRVSCSAGSKDSEASSRSSTSEERTGCSRTSVSPAKGDGSRLGAGSGGTSRSMMLLMVRSSLNGGDLDATAEEKQQEADRIGRLRPLV